LHKKGRKSLVLQPASEHAKPSIEIENPGNPDRKETKQINERRQ
jgi:hypothetical protein